MSVRKQWWEAAWILMHAGDSFRKGQHELCCRKCSPQAWINDKKCKSGCNNRKSMPSDTTKEFSIWSPWRHSR